MQKGHIILGTLGAIAGILVGVLAVTAEPIGYAGISREVGELRQLGGVVVGLSLLGLVGCILAGRRRTLGVTALVLAAGGGLMAANFHYVLPALLFTAAAMAVPRPLLADVGLQGDAPKLHPPPQTSVRCPRCKTRFGVSAHRPLRLRCPGCSLCGTLPAAEQAPSAA